MGISFDELRSCSFLNVLFKLQRLRYDCFEQNIEFIELSMYVLLIFDLVLYCNDDQRNKKSSGFMIIIFLKMFYFMLSWPSKLKVAHQNIDIF